MGYKGVLAVWRARVSSRDFGYPPISDPCDRRGEVGIRNKCLDWRVRDPRGRGPATRKSLGAGHALKYSGPTLWTPQRGARDDPALDVRTWIEEVTSG